ncbi:hypothetical protein G6F22_021626 [Rhizopus arrhizus]|nr:hypothetical protein G6F22_021626 [Rhizopus arrhizus]
MHRPEPFARQQHHACFFGQPEQQFVGLDIGQQPFDEFRTDLAAHLLHVEQRVVIDDVLVYRVGCSSHAAIQRGLAPSNQPLHGCLVMIRGIHKRKQRKKHQLHLLRRR